MVKEGASDDKSVGEVEAWHGCELIHVVATGPYTFRMPLSDGVLEAERLWQKSRWHAGIKAEDDKSREVA